MTYFHYPDGKHIILNGIDNSVMTLTNTVPLLTCQFFMSLRPGVFGKRFYPTKDLLELFLRYGA